MIGMSLVLLVVLTSLITPRVLVDAGWVYRAPRLGIAAWYATLVAIGTALLGAIVSWLAPWQVGNAPVCVAWRWCLAAARGAHGTVGRIVGYTVLAVMAAIAVRAAVAVVRAAWTGRRHRRVHVDTLDLAGRPDPRLGATVVEHPIPAAYVVAGGRRRLVVTTGALHSLAPEELAAVLAHERAHATGRHDLVIDGIRLLQRAFPRSVLLAHARRELTRLVEMRADDVAVRDHERISLARALVVMTGHVSMAATARVDESVPALAATGGDAVARMYRLLDPPAPLPGRYRWPLAAGVAMFAFAPLAVLAAGYLYPALGTCPTFA